MARARRGSVVEATNRGRVSNPRIRAKARGRPLEEGDDSGDKGTGWRSAMGGGFLASLFGSGDKRPRCPPSGGNPSNLVGKRVDTEEDVL